MKLKFNFFVLLFFLFIFSSEARSAEKLWRGSTMDSQTAAKRWGSAEFDTAKFKAGDLNLRAAMAASLLKQFGKKENQFVGKSAADVRNLLGAFSGFYFTDAYPTYLIQVGKSRSEETWQIVFLLDRDRRVSSVIVHKNCCDP